MGQAQPQSPPSAGDVLYDKVKCPAEIIKIILQMIAGVILTVLIILKFVHHFFLLSSFTGHLVWLDVPIQFLHTFVYNLPTLDIVGFALAYTTAIELAYALFTHDLDEAVTPLITGLAATLLIIISNLKTIDIQTAIGIAIVILALAGLFTIGKVFKLWE